jgi:hypothetical protein
MGEGKFLDNYKSTSDEGVKNELWKYKAVAQED